MRRRFQTLWAASIGKLNGSKSSAQAIRNSAWFTSSRLLSIAVNIVVVVFISRYLGPSRFGVFSYALSAAAILGVLANLGLNSVITKELVNNKQKQKSILGTALMMRFIAGLSVTALGIIIIHILKPDDAELALFVGLLLMSETFRSGIIFSFWFEARANARPIAVARLVIVLIGAAVKIGMVLAGASLLSLVIAQSLDGLLVLIVFGWLYSRRSGALAQIRPSWGLATRLLRSSAPLIISGLTAVVYLRIDQIMLGQILGNEAVGIYAVAARISEFWYFVPTAVATAVFPFLLRLKLRDPTQYEKRVQNLLDILTWLGIVVAILVSLIGPILVTTLFGVAYASAGALLVVHVWGGVFMAPRALVSKWLIAEDAIRYSVLSQGAGAILNIILNLLLIPRFGAMGAAVATVFSYATSGYLVFLIPRHTRGLAAMMTRAYIAPIRALSPARGHAEG